VMVARSIVGCELSSSRRITTGHGAGHRVARVLRGEAKASFNSA
jgi:hypothetical protein